VREILGDAKNIRALLGNAKYAIDYYQHEYRWQTKHVTELYRRRAERIWNPGRLEEGATG